MKHYYGYATKVGQGHQRPDRLEGGQSREDGRGIDSGDGIEKCLVHNTYLSLLLKERGLFFVSISNIEA